MRERNWFHVVGFALVGALVAVGFVVDGPTAATAGRVVDALLFLGIAGGFVVVSLLGPPRSR